MQCVHTWFVELNSPTAAEQLQQLWHAFKSAPHFAGAELLHSAEKPELWLLLSRWQGAPRSLAVSLPAEARAWCFMNSA